jgi:hypothetical protein
MTHIFVWRSGIISNEFFIQEFDMKSLQIVVAAAMMLAFSSANAAAGFEGFFGNGYHYSVEIKKNADGTYKMIYGDSMGASNILECTATGNLQGDKLVVTERECTEYEIDENEKKNVTRQYPRSQRLEYVVTADGIDEYNAEDPSEVTNLERIQMD